MKKMILILAMITMLVISGCGTGETEYTRPTTETGEPTVSQKDLGAEDIPEKQATVKTTTKKVSTLSSDIQKIVDKASSVESVEYTYNEFKTGTTGYSAKVWLKGDKMKQVVEPGSGTWAVGTKFDTIYIDLAAEKSEAYCEDKDCDDRNAIVSSTYENFVVETPFDVLENLEGFKAGEEMYDNKETYVIESETDDGTILRVWLWTYNGVPLKYEITNPDDDNKKLRSVVFSNLHYNGVKDIDLEHQEYASK